MCAQESERMYPVAGGTVRMPKKDVVVGGQYLIPQDVTVFLPVSPAMIIFNICMRSRAFNVSRFCTSSLS